ncbi:GGDEF domain-containing protein [Actinoplanes sp. NPDC026619]|uniref:GGDEF domain-containing protein n=1 Tax=Actinoplanes sp. NPDC026619 TaxID=3155798 RepID=UPI00340A3943
MTRWPRPAGPAWPVHAVTLAGTVHAVTLAGTVLAAIAYALAGPHLRVVIFAMATLVPVATFGAALATGHLKGRPWVIATAGVVLLAASMAFWSDWVPGHHFGRAEGRAADFGIASAHLLFLAGAAGALRRRGIGDLAGLLDAALLGVCVAGPAWAWLIAPRLTSSATLVGEMLALTDVAMLAAVLACLARVGRRATGARGPIGYLLLCCTATLGGHIAGTLTAQHGSSAWTAIITMSAYLTLAPAAVHPATPQITDPDQPPEKPSTRPPLLWIGIALCANPLTAMIQGLRGEEVASVVLPVCSMLAVPLVLLRLRQMSLLRNQAEQTLAHHALHDELTGLANRRHITAEIDRALTDLDRGALDEVTVILLDLDGFKPVNDRYGHQAGDVVLRTVAARLSDAAGEGDVVGRIGGDEFVLLRRGPAPEDLPQQATALVGQPIAMGAASVRVGVSAGAATATRGERIARDTLIGWADAAMYAQKAAHRKEREPALR